MTDPDYFTAYPHFALQRSASGVLTVRMHTEGGPALLGPRLHRDFPQVIAAAAADRDNRVLVLTGTGDVFMTGSEPPAGRETHKPLVWDEIFWEGRAAMRELAELPMPFIAAINGPATIHSDWVLMGDITIASDTLVLQDGAHFAANVVPGDGVHVVWEELIGLNRARYAALTQQRIDARQAREWGMVNEVLPPEIVLPRALELAEELARRPQLLLRLTPLVLRRKIARRLESEVTTGMALEGLTIADWPYRA